MYLATFQSHGDHELLLAATAIFGSWFITISPVTALNRALTNQSTFDRFEKEDKTENDRPFHAF